MKTFFASKYPVIVGYGKDGERIKVPTETIFTIDGMVMNCFELLPIKKVPEIKAPVMVDAAMLILGFTEQDGIE